MHDPQTVAFEIKNLFVRPSGNFGYRPSILTIWHCDPETDGTDDSCGWTFSKITKSENERLDKIAKDQYGQLFARKRALIEGKGYASICFDQDTFGVIYWMWRHFNKKFHNVAWQYGKALSNKELQYVYQLATDPVDNFQYHKCDTLEEFREMIYLIYRCWKRHHRKWYQHPKWHIHHWKLQFHPWQNLKRRYWDKCSVCGKRGFKGSAYGDWHGTKIWHAECDDSQKPVPTEKEAC